MPHPLAIKYGTGDPTLWNAAKRSEAREELQAVLGAGREGKKKLASADRIELMRIWLSIISVDSPKEKPADAATTAPVAKPKQGFRLKLPTIPGLAFIRGVMRTMRPVDYIFILVLCGITVSVTALGVHAVQEVLRMEEVKKEAEDLVQWFKTTADERKNANFAPAACSKAATTVWKDCLAALLDEGGPLHGKTNAFVPGRALVSKKCDQQDIDTIGTIIVEKGAIPPGSSSYAYTAFDGTEPVNKDMVLRIIVCGRGFHLIKVQNELSW